jgi:hypothetical protein
VLEVAFAEHEYPVGELGADREHEPLGVGVRSGTSGRDRQHVDAGVGEHDVEGGGELAARSRTRYLNGAACSPRWSSRLQCGLLCAPSTRCRPTR